jgi:CubicO group peptidase (beta-lactamase class C family)
VSRLDGGALAAWLDDQASQHLFSGVALVTERGQTLFEHAAGLAHRGHGVRVTGTTRFQVASVTKMITAATAMKLVEEGALALDRPLAAFLPADRRPAALDERHTLHHLLTHTSGLPNYHDDEDETWESFTAAMERIPFSQARGPMDLLPLFADLPAAGELGEFVYCDANFVLIGVLVEWVAGRAFADVAREKVLVPAGMEDTSFAELDLEPPGLATGYVVSETPADTWRSNIYQVPAAGMPDGGMTTTARDLDRFIEAFDGGKIVSKESVELMLTPHAADDEETYGYGMELVVDEETVTIYGHSGLDPGVSSVVSRYVDPGITVTVLCNQDRGSWPTAQKIAEMLGIHDPRE